MCVLVILFGLNMKLFLCFMASEFLIMLKDLMQRSMFVLYTDFAPLLVEFFVECNFQIHLLRQCYLVTIFQNSDYFLAR